MRVFEHGPYIEVYDAFAMTNPFSPRWVVDEPHAKNGCKRLCELWSMDFVKVWSELVDVRVKLGQGSTAREAEANTHLLDFLNRSIMENGVFFKHQNAMEFTRNCFAQAISSHYAETLFSIMAYTMGDRRAKSSLETWASVLHLRSTKFITANPAADGKIGEYIVAFDGAGGGKGGRKSRF